MNMLDVLDGFNGLPPVEQKAVIMASLVEGSLRYEDLSQSYVEYLEQTNRKKSQKMNKAVHWLVMYWGGGSHAKSKLVKAAVAYLITEGNYMKGAGIEDKMKDYLKENPYEEEEDGMPKTELHL